MKKWVCKKFDLVLIVAVLFVFLFTGCFSVNFAPSALPSASPPTTESEMILEVETTTASIEASLTGQTIEATVSSSAGLTAAPTEPATSFSTALSSQTTDSGMPGSTENSKLPEGFVYLDEVIPDIFIDIRYSTGDNFTGRVVEGYEANKCIISCEAATALKKVQNSLKEEGVGLIVYDAYRPQRAVRSFVAWANDPADTLMKEKYYPDIEKKDLIPMGFIASRSAHSRGSTVDLSLVDIEDGSELDMGGSLDFFGEISAYDAKDLNDLQRKNRNLLRTVMNNYGFRSYSKEWWHFTLREEPFPDTYFDFPVK